MKTMHLDPDRVNELLPMLARCGIILPEDCAGYGFERFLGCLHTAALTAEKNGCGAGRANSLNGFSLSLDRGPLANPANPPAPAPGSLAEAEAAYQEFRALVDGDTAAQQAADFDALVNRGRHGEPYRWKLRERPDAF